MSRKKGRKKMNLKVEIWIGQKLINLKIMSPKDNIEVKIVLKDVESIPVILCKFRENYATFSAGLCSSKGISKTLTFLCWKELKPQDLLLLLRTNVKLAPYPGRLVRHNRGYLVELLRSNEQRHLRQLGQLLSILEMLIQPSTTH